MKRRAVAAVAFVVAVAAVPGATAAAQSPRFPDVPAGHYAFEAIEWAATVGVTTGYDDGTFKPQRPLSKRHAVVFMQRYYDEILKADQSDDFTRGDMMVLLKAINDGTLRGDTPQDATPGAAGSAQSPRFPDVPASHYAYEAIEWAATVGVTTGYDDGTFKPERPLSRRHAVVFMQRYYDEILGADQSDDFTRGDMMVLLKAINDGTLRDTGTVGYTTVSVGFGLACGLRTDGTVDCWGEDFDNYGSFFGLSQEIKIDTPDGSYQDVTPSPEAYSGCVFHALRPDGTIECWTGAFDAQDTFSLVMSDSADVPDGVFQSVAGACGIRTDGTITCWSEQLAAGVPRGEFKSVAVSPFSFDHYACAIRTGGTITCWGSDNAGSLGSLDAPQGTFNSVAAASGYACAIRTGGTITCWGSDNAGRLDAPQGTFNSVAASGGYACAIRTGGTITCWGSDSAGSLDPPQGTFTAIAIGGNGHAAAVSGGGTVSFWGGTPVTFE